MRRPLMALSRKSLLTIYKSFLRPLLDYLQILSMISHTMIRSKQNLRPFSIMHFQLSLVQ